MDAPLVEANAPVIQADRLVEAILHGGTELQELCGEDVAVVAKPSALEFSRLVCRKHPVLITDAVNDWNAFERWKTDEYLMQALNDQKITVSVTPDGFADAIHNGSFVTPLEEQMTYEQFVIARKQSLTGSSGIYYVQLQNSNLTEEHEFKPLLKDVGADIPFASEALGRQPEAVNIWIGTNLSTTSLHKDHYENLYVVITGEKHFILYPPSDFAFLYEREFPGAHWTRNSEGVFVTEPDNPPSTIPWIAVDPLYPDFATFPRFAHAHPMQVTVRAGQMLYIPALTYHHVRQSNDAQGRCIAVNYWWDMDFDHSWAYYQMLRELNTLLPK